MTTNKERMKWINEGVMHERERIIEIINDNKWVFNDYENMEINKILKLIEK